jgi:Flp pilus assembly protein TadG
MIKKLIALLHRGRPDNWDRGTLTVEFAFAAPILVVAVLGAADIGTLMNTAASLRGATRAGAEYAKANWNNPSVANLTTGTEQKVCGFLELTLSSGTCSPVTPGVTNSCACNDNTSVSPCPPTGTNPCASQTPSEVIQYVTVTAQQTFNPILSWASFVFPNPVQASTKVRTQ